MIVLTFLLAAAIHVDVSVGEKTLAVRDDPMKVVKIFFKEPDYYIHGTDEEHLLGDAASHGCIRMAPDHAFVLAKLAMESGGAGKPDSWYQNVMSGKRSVTVKLPKRVPIRITP